MTDHAHLLNGSAKAHADELLRQLTEGITAWAETPRDGCRVVEVIAEVHRDEEYEVPRYILRVRPRLEIPAGGSVWSVVFDVDLQVVAQVELLAPLVRNMLDDSVRQMVSAQARESENASMIH